MPVGGGAMGKVGKGMLRDWQRQEQGGEWGGGGGEGGQEGGGGKQETGRGRWGGATGRRRL